MKYHLGSSQANINGVLGMPLDDINNAFELMHAGDSIRSVVVF